MNFGNSFPQWYLAKKCDRLSPILHKQAIALQNFWQNLSMLKFSLTLIDMEYEFVKE